MQKSLNQRFNGTGECSFSLRRQVFGNIHDYRCQPPFSHVLSHVTKSNGFSLGPSQVGGKEGRSDMYIHCILCQEGHALHLFIHFYLLGSLGDIISNYEGTKIFSSSSSPWIFPINSVHFRLHPAGEIKAKHFQNLFNEFLSSAGECICEIIIKQCTSSSSHLLTLSASIFFCLANFLDSFCFFFSFFDSLIGVCGWHNSSSRFAVCNSRRSLMLYRRNKSEYLI